jgi:hypothetical protein
MIHRTDECRRRQHAKPLKLLKPLGHRMLRRHGRELVIDRGNARLERADFVDDERDGVAEQIRERDLGVLEDARHAREYRAGTHSDGQALFA